MRYTQFSRLSLSIVAVFLFCSALTAPTFARGQESKKTEGQSESDTATEGKPEKKKKVDKKAHKEKKPQLQILGTKVTYGAPRRWTKPQVSTRGKLEALQFVIPLPAATTAASNTSAIVIAEPNIEKLSLVDFSNSKIPRKYPAGTVVADQTDGDSWRTVVSYVHEANPPYTVLDRFGVAAGLRVHFRIIFPKEDDAKATWLRTLAQESNEFVRNLRISDKNKVTADLFYDGGKWGMREAKAGKTAVAKGSTSSTQKTPEKTKPAATKKTVSKSSPKAVEEVSQ